MNLNYSLQNNSIAPSLTQNFNSSNYEFNLNNKRPKESSDHLYNNNDHSSQNLSKRVCINSLVNPNTQQQKLPSNSRISANSSDKIKPTNIQPLKQKPSQPSAKTPNAADIARLSHLYDIACSIIQNVWPNHSKSRKTQLCSLRSFIVETHQNSRLSIPVLEVALFYLLRAKPAIRKRREASQSIPPQFKMYAQHLSPLTQNQTLKPSHTTSSKVTPPLSSSSSSSSNSCDSQFSFDLSNTNSSFTYCDPNTALYNYHLPIPSKLSRNVTISNFTSGFSDQSEPQKTLTRINSESTFNFKINNIINQPESENCNVETKVPSSNFNFDPNSLSNLRSTINKLDLPNNTSNTYPSSINQNLYNSDNSNFNVTANLPSNQTINSNISPDVDITKCGRRMFVASLICAAKFILDCSISNKVWKKITNLPSSQISAMEIAFLDLVGYKLHVSDSVFRQWSTLLQLSNARYGRIVIPEILLSKFNSFGASVLST
ncbi:G1/S-specific cyclin pas1 [Smittium culicis]|uniref:G1/S-specific cyclin pas1 n=1 Tax=Smittium culicis TaxID=133412 RepID=A0A1R1YU15_9FUNG|nr:G1/S-specific cyclin pas1 [Smittium culicis]